MTYVLSDIHGCYDKYMRMLELIDLKDEDTLYVLGDVVDRGEEGLRVLIDMSYRWNVIPLLGNHDYMAHNMLRTLNTEITEENYSTQLDADALVRMREWHINGGFATQKEFSSLSIDERESVLEYFEEFSLCEDIRIGEKRFVLAHAGLYNFSPTRPAESYTPDELIWKPCDYSKKYYDDSYLITGHTPTFTIDSASDGRIYKANNHLAIDCGAVFGKKLGCIRLEDFEEYYV